MAAIGIYKEIDTMENKTVYDYTVYVKGLFGRNKSVKFKSFDMLMDSESALTLEQVRERLPSVLAAIKIKGEAFIKVCVQKSEVERHEGYATKTTNLFADSATLIQETVKGI